MGKESLVKAIIQLIPTDIGDIEINDDTDIIIDLKYDSIAIV